MSAVVVLHPACQARLSLLELCNLAGLYGYVISSRRGKSGRSWLVLTRAGGAP